MKNKCWLVEFLTWESRNSGEWMKETVESLVCFCSYSFFSGRWGTGAMKRIINFATWGGVVILTLHFTHWYFVVWHIVLSRIQQKKQATTLNSAVFVLFFFGGGRMFSLYVVLERWILQTIKHFILLYFKKITHTIVCIFFKLCMTYYLVLVGCRT